MRVTIKDIEQNVRKIDQIVHDTFLLIRRFEEQEEAVAPEDDRPID